LNVGFTARLTENISSLISQLFCKKDIRGLSGTEVARDSEMWFRLLRISKNLDLTLTLKGTYSSLFIQERAGLVKLGLLTINLTIC